MKLLNALIPPVTAALLAVAGLAGCASAAASALPRAAASHASALSAAGSRIPWHRIGPGWELVQDTTSTDTRPGPVTLDLVDPSGHRYQLYRWAAPASRSGPGVPSLLAWSADKTRALLQDPASGRLEQISLASGSVTRFTLAGHATASGYAGSSRDILGDQFGVLAAVPFFTRENA